MSVTAQRALVRERATVVARPRAAARARVGAWLAETDHTAIGKRFIVAASVFFALGGVLALIMRLQLARPLAHVVGPDLYDQMFTTHGTNMMFLFAVPMMQGLGLYFVPQMVGAKNLAFPRLAAFAFWMYLFGGAVLWISLLANTGPDAGWFSYVPLAGPQHSAGKRVDVWAQLITFTELSGLATATNIICTVFKHKAPGMSLDRLPIFVWSQLVTSFMIVFALPAVVTASSCLALDRLVGTHFFNPAEGGDALMFQHMFWFFGHPEVYIIFLPGLGMVSEIVTSFAKRPLVGYVPVVLSNVATAILGFGLWVHHMFATGVPQLAGSFFTGASMLIAIPTGVQFFCCIATLWGSRPAMKTPFLFVLAFFATFLVGGLTGVMLAAVPINVQVHDTFFVVAHLHYVLIGGSVFPLLGALHYWFPRITGRLMDETIGAISCALVFVGFNATFFPQHLLGLHGMPRRVYTYLPETGWGTSNLAATIGAFVLGLGVLAFLLNVVRSVRGGAPSSADPWGSPGIEWSLPAPTPRAELRETVIVPSRYPLWIGRLGRVVGLGAREQLVTRIVDAEPDHKTKIMGPTLMPLLAAIATGATIIACMFTPWGLPIGTAFIAAPLVAWFWPHDTKKEDLHEVQP